MLNEYKPAFVLLAVTLIAAFLLGVVYVVTEGPIAEQKAKAEAASVSELLPATATTQADEVTAADTSVNRVITCYAADGQIAGFAVKTSPKGYAGAVDIMVGFDTAGVIQGIKILSHSETPGLGANAALPGFTDQYKSKSGVLRVTKVKGNSAPDEVEAITSATITSNAVTTGVNDATAYFTQHLKAGMNP